MSGVELFTIGQTAITLADAAAVTSAVIGAGGALAQGQAQSQAASYNARIAENSAANARAAAAVEAERERRRAFQITGAQSAAYAKGGVTASGSALDVIGDTAAQAEYDALLVTYGGEMKAANAQGEAGAQRFMGDAATRSSYFSAGSSILTGASRLRGRQGIRAQAWNGDL